MILRLGFWLSVGLTLGLCTHIASACENPVTVPEEEPINEHCPGQQVSSCTIINPAAVDDWDDWDYYSFDTTAGTLITVGTDDPGGAPFTDTTIELWNSGCNVILAEDGNSGPRDYSLIYQFSAPYTGTYRLRVHGSFSYDPRRYEAFIFCGGLPKGACCLASGDCQLIDRVNCEWQGGFFFGEGTECELVECPQMPANDLCADAIAIPTPGFGILSGDTFFAHNDYDPWYPSCTDMPAMGRDVVYRLDLEPGDIVELTYTQVQADGAVYIATNCGDVALSCVSGADETDFGGVERLTYVAGTPIPGACCYRDLACEFISEEACTEGGGIWRGGWTDCDPDYCYLVHGACCLPDYGGCLDSDPWECAELAGEYQGDGVMCYWGPCPLPPGACCFENGDCQLLSGQQCFLAEGFFLGIGTGCDPNPCTVPFGACCDPDHTCHIRTPEDCTAAGGGYQGDYVPCEETTCGEPVGACCFADGRCVLLTEAQCVEYLGIWLGWDVPCDPNPCPAAPPRSAPVDAQAYYLILDTRFDETGGPWTLAYSITRPSGVAEWEITGGAADLIGNAPNPFVGSTRISYRLDSAGPIRLELFDVGGRAVRCLVDGVVSGGGAIEWDGRDGQGNLVPAGVYFARLTAGGAVASRPLIRLE